MRFYLFQRLWKGGGVGLSVRPNDIRRLMQDRTLVASGGGRLALEVIFYLVILSFLMRTCF